MMYTVYIYTILYLDFPVSHMAFIKSLIETSIARVYCWDDPRQVNDGTCHQKACFFLSGKGQLVYGPIMFYRNMWGFPSIWVPQNGWFISWKVLLNG